MNNWKIYKNGNYIVKFNLDDGTKIRETEEDEFIPDHAENMDIKLTNQCDGGCKWCHEGSYLNGKHGDILNEKFIDTLHPYQEAACLSGDTYVFNNTGAIRIDELKVGDYIFDSDHELRRIININTSNKPTYMINGDRGMAVKCSEDHPFLSDGNLVFAKEMKNKNIDKLSPVEDLCHREINVLDMSKYIHPWNSENVHSVGGKIFEDHTVRISNSGRTMPRYINLNTEIMYLYGWYVAEGSNKSLVMHKKELPIAQRLGEIWKKYFFTDYHIYENDNKNSIVIELYPQSNMDAFFVKAMKSGTGARNKSIGFLFEINDRELIRSALLGLFDGDGCYRVREKDGNKYYQASLKTSSRKLAYEVSYILAKWFGVYSSIHHGMNSERYIEGRKLEPTDYYAVNVYGAQNLKIVFPERFNNLDSIREQKHNTYKFKDIQKIKDETLYDITLEDGNHIFPINGYILTHNCGGGNILSHPDLIPFLHKLKERKVIANATVNQIHFEKNQDLIRKLVDEKLIYGLGISLVNPTENFIELVKQYPNAVIHVINGVLKPEDVKALENNNLKMLILGYKHLRRGNEYFDAAYEKIEKNQKWLYDNLEGILDKFKVVSFDNLAIEQLNVKRLLSQEEWDEFYMGNDGQSTYYIDMVERKFAKSSTAPMDKRYDLLDSVDDMFNVIRMEND